MSKEQAVRGREIEAETERKSIGVALVIVGIDPSRNGENATQPKLWTIKEKNNKPSTGKIAGQISLPGETRKIAEKSIGSTIGGALAEFTNNSFIIINNLFLIPESLQIKGKLFVNKNPIDIAIITYEGSLTNSIEPVDKDEVSANGWMTMTELQKIGQPMIRGFVLDLISLENSEGLISKAVSDYSRNPTKRLPVSRILPEDFFSIREFFERRERLPDVSLQ